MVSVLKKGTILESFIGLSEKMLNRLQVAQNHPARILNGTPNHVHITPVLSRIHRLPVRQCVTYKLLITLQKLCTVPLVHSTWGTCPLCIIITETLGPLLITGHWTLGVDRGIGTDAGRSQCKLNVTVSVILYASLKTFKKYVHFDVYANYLMNILIYIYTVPENVLKFCSSALHVKVFFTFFHVSLVSTECITKLSAPSGSNMSHIAHFEWTFEPFFTPTLAIFKISTILIKSE